MNAHYNIPVTIQAKFEASLLQDIAFVKTLEKQLGEQCTVPLAIASFSSLAPCLIALLYSRRYAMIHQSNPRVQTQD